MLSLVEGKRKGWGETGKKWGRGRIKAVVERGGGGGGGEEDEIIKLQNCRERLKQHIGLAGFAHPWVKPG